MFGLPSVRLGKPFGIPLEIDASWLIVFFLVASTLTLNYLPVALPDREPVLYVVLGVLTALAFFGSLVLHELAHSLVARAGGLRVSKVTLFALGGVREIVAQERVLLDRYVVEPPRAGGIAAPGIPRREEVHADPEAGLEDREGRALRPARGQPGRYGRPPRPASECESGRRRAMIRLRAAGNAPAVR